MQKLCGVVLAAWLCALPLLGQNAASNVPDAPQAPAPDTPAPAGTSAGAKPSFTLPPVTYDRPTGPALEHKKTPEEECPGDLDKAPDGEHVSKELEGPVRNYRKLVTAEIGNYWMHSIPRSLQRDAWAPGRVLAVYFKIRPDGSYTAPQITSSSGKEIYDHLAIDAVKSRDAYPPLPAGMTKPIKVCFRFAYNVGPRNIPEPNYDSWEDKAPAKR